MITVEDNLDIMPMTFTDKKVLVVGLARSGIGAASLLSSLGARVSVSDSKPRSMLESQIKKLPSDVEVITGGNPQDAFAASDLIVISPGVPRNIPLLKYAQEKGIPIISEIELAFQVMESLISLPFIGITGTNGKSTVTTLVDLMLKESGYKTLLGGNIGSALTEEIQNNIFKDGQISVDEAPDCIVAEISSFQLESIKEFRPEISAILNLSPDHLDRYNSMKDYINAKAEIFSNQTAGDYLIVNADDPLIRQVISEKLKVRSEQPKIFYFSCREIVEGIYLKDGELFVNLPNIPLLTSDFSLQDSHFPLIDVNDIKIKGVHNIENALASSLIALMAGSKPEDVKNVLRSFQGLEHRLEFVIEVNGITFINDSKGTNVGAVAKSLESFENLVLIMGGTDKGSDFSILREQMKRKVKTLILIGEAGDKIERTLGDTADTYKVKDLKKAVELSMSKASSGDTVLLSPGCASFDMFENFEERGREFKRAVREITD
jgi:UDP-N-acetylmuramoylalanine--D-glutamate ligase